jgi:organic hydroperoxide reductase OsmC/OhrA/MOSC domain-containing protein YiiM
VTSSTHRYEARCRWTGSTGLGFEGYDRAHLAVAPPAEQELTLTTGEARGDPRQLNPEQLLVMAASSCQLLWFLHLAAKARIDVVEYEDEAVGLMPGDEHPVRVTRIDLRPRIVVRGGASEDAVRRLCQLAHERCYIANSLRSEVTVEPRLETTPDRAGKVGSVTSGRVEGIYVASEPEAPTAAVSEATAVAGKGIEGDRKHRDRLPPAARAKPGRELTLIEAEALEALALEAGIDLQPGESRRQVVTRGVRLNDLVGRRFEVGPLECIGVELCEPCAHLEGLTRPGVMRGLVHRGGIRADILRGGTLRPGDPVRALSE